MNPNPEPFTWYSVTTWAEHDWQRAQADYWEVVKKWHGDPEWIQAARGELSGARDVYRHRVLSWYRRLLLPMKVGDAVPNRVAELLAEEWDEATRWKDAP